MTWYTWRRCRGALILILIGVVFLLQESHVLPWSGWLALILIGIGIILLAERMWPQPPVPPPTGYPYPGYPGQPGYPPQPGYQGQPGYPPQPPYPGSAPIGYSGTPAEPQAQQAPPPENPHTDWK
jgi:hypothetical protein